MTEREKTIAFIRIFALCVVLILAAMAAKAQSPQREHFQWVNTSDAAYWAGGTADALTSVGKREANPLWRQADGTFSPGRNFAFKFGLWGAFKGLEVHYHTPKERRIIAGVKIAVGIGWGALAIRNAGKASVR